MKMFRKSALLLLLLAFGIFALVGCGGGDEPVDTPDESDANLVVGSTDDAGYQLLTADEVKGFFDAGQAMLIIDLQAQADYDAHHLEGAIATYADPADTPELQALLDPLVEQINATEDPILLVDANGGTGTQNAVDYFADQKGIVAARFFILQGGQAAWPYAEFLAQ